MIKPYFQTERGILYQGNALDILKDIESESVDCVMTSPPYWALRDYGIEPRIWDGDKDCEHEFDIEIIKEQTKISNKTGLHNDGRKNPITEKYRETLDSMTLNEYKRGFCLKCGAWKGSLGLESTFQLYIQHLIQIFDEIKRVLKKTGTCWVNIGDTYGTVSGAMRDGKFGEKNTNNQQMIQPSGVHKSLCQIPERFSIAMTDNGWIKRNTIIWEKPNCMPSSADDRFTVDFEYLYFFVKNQKYWFEQQFDKHIWASRDKRSQEPTEPKSGKVMTGQYAINKVRYGEQGRNKRCIWKIPTQPFPEAHFAVYPEQLCYTPIKAGCPEYICKKCGKAREKIYKPSEKYMGYVNYAPYRNLIDLLEFGEYIRKSRSQKDLSRNQVEELLGTNTALAWWEGRKYYGEMQHQLPSPDNYKKLKNILDLDDRYDKAILTIFKKTKNGWINKATNPNPLIEGNRKGGKSLTASYEIIGYTDCGCNAGFEPGIVLDLFAGAGTTLLVAEKLGRKNIGIEISKEYCDIAVERIKKETAQFKLNI